jgi:hypothetical protein
MLAKAQDKDELVNQSKECLTNWLQNRKPENNIDLVILLNMMIFAGDPTQVDQESMIALNEFYQKRFLDDSMEGQIKLHYTTLSMISNLYEILKAMNIKSDETAF